MNPRYSFFVEADPAESVFSLATTKPARLNASSVNVRCSLMRCLGALIFPSSIYRLCLIPFLASKAQIGLVILARHLVADAKPKGIHSN